MTDTSDGVIAAMLADMKARGYFGWASMCKDLLSQRDARFAEYAELARHLMVAETERDAALAAVARMSAEMEALRAALDHIRDRAEAPQEAYDRNGPQWTTPAGNEYEDTSSHLNFANEIADAARAALSTAPPPRSRVEISEDWSMRMARLEGNAEIGAGLLALGPLSEPPAAPSVEPGA